MNDEYSSLLINVPFLCYLSSPARDRLLQRFATATYRFGDVIVREGDPSETFFLIVSGKARVITTANHGAEIPLRALGPGDYFGEMGLLREGQRTKTVRATSDVTALTLSKAEFLELVAANADVRGYLELEARHRHIENFLRQFSCFGAVKPEILRNVLENFQTVTFAAGETIIREGYPPGPLYLIENGYCHAFHPGAAGAKKSLAYLRQGDFFGELSLLRRSPRSASVEAVSDCVLLSLDGSRFQTLIDQYPELRAIVQSRIQEYENQAGPNRVPADFARILAHRFHEPAVDGDPTSDASAPKSLPGARSDGSTWRKVLLNALIGRHLRFVSQIDEADCGAAALAMVCRYWGGNVSLPYLRELTGTGLEGTTLQDLCRACIELGLQARMVKLSFRNLDQIPLPAIVHWQHNHWVVLTQRKRRRLQIADPATRIRWIDRDEFARQWTGYGVVIDHVGECTAVSESTRFADWLLPMLSPLKGSLAKIFLITLAITICQMAFPVLTQVVVDGVVVTGDATGLNALVSLLGGVLVITLLLTILQRYMISHAAARLDHTILRGIIDRMLALPLSYFARRSPDDIQRRLEGAGEVRRFVVQSVGGGIIAAIQAIAFVSLMAFFSLRMTQVFLILVPIYVGLMYFSAKILKPAFDEIQESESRYRVLQRDIVQGIETVKGAGAEQSYQHLILRDFDRLVHSKTKSTFNVYCYDGTVQALGFLATILFLRIGAELMLSHQLSIGDFIAFQMLMAMCYVPILTMLNLWEEIQLYSVLFDRLDDIVECAPEVTNGGQREPVHSFQGRVEFRNVSFSYGGLASPVLLSNISFTATPCQRIAIIGKTNSGKSLLARLIAGLLEPSSGTILFDDLPMTSIRLPTLRAFIGLVSSREHIFTGTVLSNIAFGQMEPNFDRAVQAAKVAHIHDFILSLPQQYDTKISASDVRLTVPQCQCLGIARAMYRDPSVLILDEAISAMDHETERVLLASVQKAMTGRTIFIVTTRLETIRQANQILVLDNGRLVERGTDSELMRRRGFYYQLTL